MSNEELVHLDLGLRGFSEDPVCPKCSSTAIKTTWHETIIINSNQNESPPCGQWAFRGLLTGPVGEHLCRFCHTCNYGWPEQTADG